MPQTPSFSSLLLLLLHAPTYTLDNRKCLYTYEKYARLGFLSEAAWSRLAGFLGFLTPKLRVVAWFFGSFGIFGDKTRQNFDESLGVLAVLAKITTF